MKFYVYNYCLFRQGGCYYVTLGGGPSILVRYGGLSAAFGALQAIDFAPTSTVMPLYHAALTLSIALSLLFFMHPVAF